MTVNVLNWDDGGTISSEDISLFEHKFAIKLPNDFKVVVMSNDGASSDLPCIDFGGEKEKVFSGLIPLLEDNDYSRTIVELMADTDVNFPNGIVPFGDDPFGNLDCLDYRSNSIPTIVYWDHDLEMNGNNQFGFVAENFTDFLNCLYLPEDE